MLMGCRCWLSWCTACLASSRRLQTRWRRRPRWQRLLLLRLTSGRILLGFVLSSAQFFFSLAPCCFYDAVMFPSQKQHSWCLQR